MHRPIRLVPWLGLVALAMCLVCLPAASEPQSPPVSAPTLYLHAGEFAPSLGLDRNQAISAASRDAQAQPDAEITYIVQFSGPIQTEWYTTLIEIAQVQSYLPDFAYKVRINRSAIPALWKLPSMVWAGPWEPDYKLSPTLDTNQFALIWLADDDATLSLSGLELDVLSSGPGYLVASGSLSRLRELAAHPAVTWIQPIRTPKLTNDVATDLMGAPVAWQSGLQGQGQLITVADTGIDTGIDYPHRVGDMHPDLDNRVAHIRSWPISPAWYGALYNPTDDDGAADVDFGHGTHVAGSIAGDGSRSLGQYAGVAPKAQLAVQALEQYCDWTPAYVAEEYQPYMLVGIPQDVSDLYNEAYDWGSRIHTNSWNLGETNLYTQEAAQTDAFIWDHQDMCILFSVGNEARDANADGLVDLGSIAAPATAKNIIAVGGCESLRLDRDPTYGEWMRDDDGIWFPVSPIRDDAMADAGTDGLLAVSGRGPTSDGRIAPHIVAPGSWIVSILSSQASTNYGSWGPVWPYSDDYHYLGGTSMSAPLAAGAVALIREAYMDQGHTPSAALLKATLIQSASDVAGQYADPFNQAGPVPNMHEGWGALDLASATVMSRQWVDDDKTLTTGQVSTHTFDVPSSSQPIKVTLVWTDPAADPQASRSLVNDLNLRVTAPDGHIYQGNIMVNGWSTTGGMADNVNNVECVYLPVSQEGQYTATVVGYNVPIPGQRFALLIDTPDPQTPRIHLPLAMAQPAPTSTPTLQPTVPANPTATPSQTPTVAPSPTATTSPSPTPTMGPDEWRDDFSGIGGKAWYVGSTDSFRTSYTDETYHFEISPAASQKISLPGRHQDGNYRLAVTAWAGNDASQAMGLVISCEEDAEDNVIGYLAFVVTTDGRYGIVRRDGTYLVGLTPSTVINTGQGTNRLMAAREGDQIMCEVNGVRLITMNSEEVARGDRFGLLSKSLASNWTYATFDDFWLQPDGVTPSCNQRQGEQLTPAMVD